MPLVDSHTHCEASEDSETPVCELVRAAALRGITMLSLTDHVEVIDFFKGEYDKAAETAWKLMEDAQKDLPAGFSLLRGIELGEPHRDVSLSDRILAAHPYDFVLASMHRLSEKIPDYYYIDYTAYSDGEIERQMQRHFEETYKMVRWNGFDSLAHLTYPFRYLPEKWRQGDYRRWQGVIDELLGLLAQNGKSLEINTSGLRKGQGVTSPDLPLIARFRQLGGQTVTLGSDAHRAQEVGADIGASAALAVQAGFTHAAVYVQRTQKQIPLADIG